MNAPTDPRAFRGTGLAFPLAVTPHGKLATARAETKIEQAIWLILSTAQGERLMRPNYGCGVHELVFAPNTPQTAARVVDMVRRALVAQEPRIAVLDVTSETSAGDPSVLLIRIDYRINENNSVANMVYPFFVTEGA
jgi:phage baseplate assembly protein W